MRYVQLALCCCNDTRGFIEKRSCVCVFGGRLQGRGKYTTGKLDDAVGRSRFRTDGCFGFTGETLLYCLSIRERKVLSSRFYIQYFSSIFFYTLSIFSTLNVVYIGSFSRWLVNYFAARSCVDNYFERFVYRILKGSSSRSGVFNLAERI